VLSRRSLGRLLWAVLLLLAIRIALRHPYAPFLFSQRAVTNACRRPPYKAPRTFRTLFTTFREGVFSEVD
jgi:hypothetical protein